MAGLTPSPPSLWGLSWTQEAARIPGEKRWVPVPDCQIGSKGVQCLMQLSWGQAAARSPTGHINHCPQAPGWQPAAGLEQHRVPCYGHELQI